MKNENEIDTDAAAVAGVACSASAAVSDVTSWSNFLKGEEPAGGVRFYVAPQKLHMNCETLKF